MRKAPKRGRRASRTSMRLVVADLSNWRISILEIYRNRSNKMNPCHIPDTLELPHSHASLPISPSKHSSEYIPTYFHCDLQADPYSFLCICRNSPIGVSERIHRHVDSAITFSLVKVEPFQFSPAEPVDSLGLSLHLRKSRRCLDEAPISLLWLR